MMMTDDDEEEEEDGNKLTLKGKKLQSLDCILQISWCHIHMEWCESGKTGECSRLRAEFSYTEKSQNQG